jgi:hypothetical protein
MASLTAIAVALSLTAAIPGSAETPSGPASQDNGSQHHRTMYQMMSDMTQAMTQMTDQMSHGELSQGQRRQMVEQMERMSMMMRRMSGLGARPAMKEPEWQTQMGEMRKQMDDMMHDMGLTPRTK